MCELKLDHSAIRSKNGIESTTIRKGISMDAFHRVFGMHHNWLFVAIAVVLLTLGLTVMAFRQRKSFDRGSQHGEAADPTQGSRENPPAPK